MSNCLQSKNINLLSPFFRSELTEFYTGYDIGGHCITGKNAWLYSPTVDLYAKNFKRHLEGKFVRVFVVSNVTVAERSRNKGVYSELLSFMFSLLQPGEALYVENVLFPEHLDLYLRRGFTKCGGDGDDMSPHFYLMKE